MRKILFITCLCLFATLCLNAQITNTFPDSGNAGIGTTNPTNKLVVQGDSSPNLELKNSNYSNGGFILNRTNYGHQWKWWAESNVMYFDFSTDETNYSNKFTIKSNGNVGISNANPQDKLQISNTFVFHDGGHKILSLLYSPGAVDLDDTKYASEIRYDPTSGSLHLGTSSTVTNAPTARFSITKDGNVGIGTTAPNFKAHIVSTVSAKALKVENINGGYANVDVSSNRSSGNIGGFRFFTNGDTYATTELNTIVNGDFHIGTGTGSNVPSTRLAVTSSGDVGIGTSSPDYKLHVTGGAQISKTTLGVTLGSAENSWIRDEWLTGNYGPAKWNQTIAKWVRPSGTYNDIGGIVYQDEGTYFLREKAGSKLEYTNSEFLNTAYMFADIFNGNIGIGTTTPDAKLTVKGNIHTNEVKVDLLNAVAPDYVFYKDYDLKSLKAVEDYIASNGHLPNIPSAKDMETEGIMLKEMNLKLLEKIEELTLYAIEQEKKLEKVELLEEELKNQKLINKNLEDRLQKIEDLLSSKK